MALFTKLREHTSEAGRPDHREYFALLRNDADTPDALQRLAMLALKLGKTQAQIELDIEAINRIPQLRANISAGRDVMASLDQAESALHDHQKQTDQIIAQRKDIEKAMRVELGRQIGIKNAAEDAARELGRLKSKHPELLADEPAVDASTLS